MKRIFYLEKHVKIYQKFCELSKILEKISLTKNIFHKSLNKFSINWKKDTKAKTKEIFSFFVSSLLLFNSAVTHWIFWTIRDLTSFICLRKRLIFERTRNSFFLITSRSIFNLSRIWFKVSQKFNTQKQFRQI